MFYPPLRTLPQLLPFGICPPILRYKSTSVDWYLLHLAMVTMQHIQNDKEGIWIIIREWHVNATRISKFSPFSKVSRWSIALKTGETIVRCFEETRIWTLKTALQLISLDSTLEKRENLSSKSPSGSILCSSTVPGGSTGVWLGQKRQMLILSSPFLSWSEGHPFQGAYNVRYLLWARCALWMRLKLYSLFWLGNWSALVKIGLAHEMRGRAHNG